LTGSPSALFSRLPTSIRAVRPPARDSSLASSRRFVPQHELSDGRRTVERRVGSHPADPPTAEAARRSPCSSCSPGHGVRASVPPSGDHARA
jgi:hypothetical protein